MKILYPLVFLFLILSVSCNHSKENLDYPKSIAQIDEVIISRPDKQSNRGFPIQKKLNPQETTALLRAINSSRPIGITKFYPEYLILFITKGGENKRMKGNKNTIKGYKNDFSYKFNPPPFLNEF